MTISCASPPADLQDYERIHRDWLSAFPHVVKINSAFALREVIERPGVEIALAGTAAATGKKSVP